MNKLEKMLLKDGWIKRTLTNDGVDYIEFVKEGFVIDIGDIIKEKGEKEH